jgi:hypothetical protein
MPIDDPISALQALNASEERQHSPISKYAKQFLAAIKLFAPPGTEFTLAALEAAITWTDRREDQNRNEFIHVIAEETTRHRSQIDQLLAESENHRRFMADEMPRLVLDGLRRAEQASTKERIRRMARIVTNAVKVGPAKGADYIEELMKIAAELSDRDVLVLATAAEQFTHQERLRPRDARAAIAAGAWTSVQWQDKAGISADEVASIGARLQSFGLVSRIERITGDTNSYMVLERGRDFIAYIRNTDE